jgi:hypothetical protein
MRYLRHAAIMAEYLAHDAYDETSVAADIRGQFQRACELMRSGQPDEGLALFDRAFERAALHGYVIPPDAPSDAPAE